MAQIKVESPSHLLPPQPARWPIVGHMNYLTSGEMYKTFLNLHRELGDIFYLNVLNKREVIVVRSPQALQHVLQMNNKNYIKGEELDVVRPLIGQGLFTSEGDYWRRQRRMMQPAFHRKQIALLAQVMIDTTAEMLERWGTLARSGQPVKIQSEMMALTMEIVTRTLFTNSLERDEIDAMSDNIGLLLSIITHRGERIIDPLSKFRFQEKKAFDDGIAKADQLVYRLIEERRKSGIRQDDLLDMLLHAEDADTGEKMNDRQIRDEVITMFLAGHETTAIGLSWALAQLSNHPDIWSKVKSEVDEVLRGQMPEASHFTQLKYTQAVFQESLRLYPPLPLTGRTALEDDVIHGYRIPAGSQVLVNFYAAHHNPAVWINPGSFEPDRFLPENMIDRPRYAYVPFGGGPRQCIGNNFALMEGTMALAMIAQKFDVTLLPDVPLTPNAIGTLRPLSTLPAKLTVRMEMANLVN